ncbi:hypothetical protein Tco_1406694, partial [Tanacetum coccineum]
AKWKNCRIPVETHVQNDTVSPEPQKSGKEYISVSADSEFKIDSQNGKTADANPVETQHNITKISSSFRTRCLGRHISDSSRTRDVVNISIPKRLGVARVKSENVAADEKESVPSEPEFCIEAGSVGNVAQFITHNCEANLVVQCVGWAAH